MNVRGDSEIQLKMIETPNKRSRFFYGARGVAEGATVLLRRETTRA